MNFGASDVIAGMTLAIKIYENGFNEENAADVRYKNFQNDIFNFRYLLEKLDDALSNAQQRYLDRRSAVLGAPGAYEPLSEDIEGERKAIVGNFLGTLRECEKLLEENRQFRFRCSNVVENLRWNLLQQEKRVDDLRRRLHFHSEKIRLVLDRLSVTLLTDLDAKVDDVLANTERNLQISHEIKHEINRLRATLLGYIAGQGLPSDNIPEDVHVPSDLISQKLGDCLLLHAPSGVQAGIPIAQGFDALLIHFEQSVDGSDQTPEKYLLFLKTRWLLAQLKEGNEYKRARPGYYYKRAVNQIEQAILARIRQPGELIAYDDSILAELQESCFHIWPVPAAEAPVQYSQAHPLHVRANEEQIATIEVASSDTAEPESVTIFKSSDERLRIVLKTSLASAPGERLVIPQSVDVREDRLIPRYTMPTMNDGSLEIAIYSRREETLYRFDTFADLCKFQSALMGYEVSHHQERVQFQFSKELKFLDCGGRVQLWQDPIAASMPQERRASGRPLSPTTLDTQSDGTWSLPRRDSLLPSLIASSTISPVEDGWEAQPIKLPAITIFTQITEGEKKGRFAIIYIQLEEGIFVDPSECKCCRDYETCSKLVLTSKRKPTFPVRVLYSDIDANGNPDPNSFDLFPLRRPRHPSFRNIMTKHTGYVLLKFKSLEEKKLFHRELDLRFRVREAQIKDRKDFESRIRLREQQPQRRHAPYGQSMMQHLQPGFDAFSAPAQMQSHMAHLASRTSFASASSGSTISPASRGSAGNISTSPSTPEPGPSRLASPAAPPPPHLMTTALPSQSVDVRPAARRPTYDDGFVTRPPAATRAPIAPQDERSTLQMEVTTSRDRPGNRQRWWRRN